MDRPTSDCFVQGFGFRVQGLGFRVKQGNREDRWWIYSGRRLNTWCRGVGKEIVEVEEGGDEGEEEGRRRSDADVDMISSELAVQHTAVGRAPRPVGVAACVRRGIRRLGFRV